MIEGEVILQGYGYKQTTTAMISHWKRQYMMLYPNRIELGESLLVSREEKILTVTRKVSCIYIMMLHMLGKCDTEIKLCVMISCFEWRFCSPAQQMSKASCITFDGSVLVENKQIKGGEVLRIQPIGSRKEFMFKFDVSNTLAYCFLVFSHSTHSQCLSLSHILLSQGFLSFSSDFFLIFLFLLLQFFSLTKIVIQYFLLMLHVYIF